MVRLKERVFEDPGAPTMIRGVCVTVQTMVAKRFSLRAWVLAMPVGSSTCLVYQSNSLLNACRKGECARETTFTLHGIL